MFDKALTIKQNAPKENALDIGKTYNNMGVLFEFQGRDADAIKKF